MRKLILFVCLALWLAVAYVLSNGYVGFLYVYAPAILLSTFMLGAYVVVRPANLLKINGNELYYACLLTVSVLSLSVIIMVAAMVGVYATTDYAHSLWSDRLMYVAGIIAGLLLISSYRHVVRFVMVSFNSDKE